jgi:hypothetical protein
MAETKGSEAEARKTEYHSRLLEILKAWLPVLTVVIGGLWGLYEYTANERKAETTRLEQTRTIEREKLEQAQRADATRRIEAQKPYLELQFKTYLRTTELVGKIIQLKPTEPEYSKLRSEFSTLYWTELALVESTDVARAMVGLESALQTYEREATILAGRDLRVAALNLAHAIRDSIQSGWKGDGSTN